MLTHEERRSTARAAVDYITGRTSAEQRQPVPNCPGWTVYNAASHIGRVAIAWEEMIRSAPDDPASRDRGYGQARQRPDGATTEELAAWAHSAIDHLAGDVERPCYFSMTGGVGSVGLWAWHAATELGIHRLDVEAAIGHDHSLTERQAFDAADYTVRFFLPAMRRATGEDPGPLSAILVGADGPVGRVDLASEVDVESTTTTIEGPPTQVLLALWGRPNRDVRLVAGDPEVWDGWRQLPSRAFQFGTWD